jgi:hypothetical protein
MDRDRLISPPSPSFGPHSTQCPVDLHPKILGSEGGERHGPACSQFLRDLLRAESAERDDAIEIAGAGEPEMGSVVPPRRVPAAQVVDSVSELDGGGWDFGGRQVGSRKDDGVVRAGAGREDTSAHV